MERVPRAPPPGRQEADDAIARGELGVPLADVLADLDAEDRVCYRAAPTVSSNGDRSLLDRTVRTGPV